MIDPIFILEAVVNGVLLGGVLALLALGLNLIFGVIDIVWIAYVDLVALSMYGVYFLVTLYHWPLWRAGLGGVVVGVRMGANPHRLYLVTSAVGGAMAGIAGALLIIQYAVHPYFGSAFGPLTFMICVLGGLGNMVGAFFAAFIMAQVISVGGVLVSTEMGYVIAFVIFIVLMFVRPGGIFARRA